MGKQEMNDWRFVVVLTTAEYYDWFVSPETMTKRDKRKIQRFISKRCRENRRNGVDTRVYRFGYVAPTNYNGLFDFTAFIR